MNTILEQLSAGIITAKQFLAAELPLFVQEYLQFYQAWYIFAVIGLTIILCIGITIIIKAESNSSVYAKGNASFMGGLLLCFPFVCWVFSVYHLMLVTFAPRVFLLREFAGLFK